MLRLGRGWNGVVTALVCAGLAACGGTLKNGWYEKDGLRYRVGAIDEGGWRRVDFSDNDLAWLHSKSAHVIALNATCENHGDPSLEVLTGHLLFGFTERELKSRELKMLDGREALFSKYEAKLDGVEVELQLVVLKKNGCVHDLIYVSPLGHVADQQAAFDAMLNAFTSEKG